MLVYWVNWWRDWVMDMFVLMSYWAKNLGPVAWFLFPSRLGLWKVGGDILALCSNWWMPMGSKFVGYGF